MKNNLCATVGTSGSPSTKGAYQAAIGMVKEKIFTKKKEFILVTDMATEGQGCLYAWAARSLCFACHAS